MMSAGMMAGLVVAGMAGAGFMANEATHGAMAEAMGLGHNHMADYGGYHCAAHDGAHGAHHAEHMHNATSMPHGSCPGGSGMHGGMVGMGGMNHG